MRDSGGGYQNIQFCAYFKPEDEVLGKISFGSFKDTVFARLSDTIVLYKDFECTVQIGKVWSNKGIHSSSIAKPGETTVIGVSGSINVADLKNRKPWENIFKLAGIQSPIGMKRHQIEKKLTVLGFDASETYKDSGHTIDYYLVGCDPNGTIKAILTYSDEQLTMYWSDEFLKGIPFRLINHKRLYYSEIDVEYIEEMQERICSECIGGIGSARIEGCSQKCKNRKK
jgi:hypothetical protein